MSKPKLLKIFDTTTDEKIYSKFINPVEVTLSGNSLVVSSTITIDGNSYITFKAPCNSSEVTSITINGNLYNIVNTLNKTITEDFFVVDALVSVILDPVTQKAFVTSGGVNPLIISSVEPTDLSILWLDTNNNVFKYYDSENSKWKIVGAAWN